MTDREAFLLRQARASCGIGKTQALGGTLCDSCWHNLIDEHPDDVKLEPFKRG
jgi:hypothetical protein